jgi:hypothetical protein
MMRRKHRLRYFIAVLLLMPLSAVAHHSGAIYDHEREVRIDGTVSQVKWANPHVYIDIETSSNDGEPVSWMIEGLPPAGMRSAGWTRQSLKQGDQVFVSGRPARNRNRNMILGITFVKEDGALLEVPEVGSRRKPSPVKLTESQLADDLSGHWSTRWNPNVAVGFLRARTAWALTDKGIAAMDSFEESMDPGNDCVPEPSPYVMIWPSGKSFEIGEDLTVIRNELGVERHVHMKIDTHDGAPSTDQGHSIGRWEDDVLVVDTTNFAPHRRGLTFGGLASGEQKHLVERFELLPNRSTMQYSFWLEDPEYLAEPRSGELIFEYRPDRAFISEPCDLESARRYLE